MPHLYSSVQQSYRHRFSKKGVHSVSSFADGLMFIHSSAFASLDVLLNSQSRGINESDPLRMHGMDETELNRVVACEVVLL